MIWNDVEITRWCKTGGVTPFDADCVNPASLDLRFSGRAKFAREGWGDWVDKTEDIKNEGTLRLHPGTFYLLDTLEFIRMPPDMVGKLFLKSSAGRMGIEHLHAGYIDPEFHGTLTLEVEVRVPWCVEISPGQRLVQLTLEQMVAAPSVSYQVIGRYNGQEEPTESKGLPR